MFILVKKDRQYRFENRKTFFEMGGWKDTAARTIYLTPFYLG
jgi:hypothetical protein